MSVTEAAIIARLLRMLGDLIRDATALIAGDLRGGMSTVDVFVVWRLEVRWTVEVTMFGEEFPQVSSIAQGRLEVALGELAESLTQVVAAGGDIGQIRGELERFRSRWEGWARRVAATESTRIASEAILAGPAARRPGARKQWVTSHDERVRDSHREVDGETVDVGGAWTVGGWPMRYPGDPEGPPEEVVGCRCGIRIVGGE
jgi:hypothetical protein